MSQKVICDPVHHHIYIDTKEEKLILDLLASKEVQRLRRIHQLGVSYYTYPGAEHSRFSHALGTFHLTKLALKYLEDNEGKRLLTKKDRLAMLAAGLLHDVGHAPFSHVLENKYGNEHEVWTAKLITSGSSEINEVLKTYDRTLPKIIVDILFHPTDKYTLFNSLLSGQLDVDRMDYLLRDSYFCGNSYGNFDYRWILHTMQIGTIGSGKTRMQLPMWTEKAIMAIEDYIFARYNMYWTVYYHRATRGYEELLIAIFERARYLIQKDRRIDFLSEKLKKFIITPDKMGYDDFIFLDDTVLFSQFRIWEDSRDKILCDLCRRFLNRNGLKWVDIREEKNLVSNQKTIEKARADIKTVLKRAGYDASYYFLESVSAAKAYSYYHFEKESAEQSAATTIFILDKKGIPTEISSRKGMQRLRVITGEIEAKKYYYVPVECRDKVNEILDRQ